MIGWSAGIDLIGSCVHWIMEVGTWEQTLTRKTGKGKNSPGSRMEGLGGVTRLIAPNSM